MFHRRRAGGLLVTLPVQRRDESEALHDQRVDGRDGRPTGIVASISDSPHLGFPTRSSGHSVRQSRG
jgi:hypothetical protein